MPKRWKNEVEVDNFEVGTTERNTLSVEEANKLFLRDIRHLAEQTRRWHRENLNALVKILGVQDIDISVVDNLSAKMLREHFVFYMLEQMEPKVNTMNGRIRSVRALSKFLHKEGYIRRDFGKDLALLKGKKVIIQTFSEDHWQH